MVPFVQGFEIWLMLGLAAAGRSGKERFHATADGHHHHHHRDGHHHHYHLFDHCHYHCAVAELRVDNDDYPVLHFCQMIQRAWSVVVVIC